MVEYGSYQLPQWLCADYLATSPAEFPDDDPLAACFDFYMRHAIFRLVQTEGYTLRYSQYEDWMGKSEVTGKWATKADLSHVVQSPEDIHIETIKLDEVWEERCVPIDDEVSVVVAVPRLAGYASCQFGSSVETVRAAINFPLEMCRLEKQ